MMTGWIMAGGAVLLIVVAAMAVAVWMADARRNREVENDEGRLDTEPHPVPDPPDAEGDYRRMRE